MAQNAASDQDLPCLPLTQQFLDTSTGSKRDSFKLMDKYAKELMGLNIYRKYSRISMVTCRKIQQMTNG